MQGILLLKLSHNKTFTYRINLYLRYRFIHIFYIGLSLSLSLKSKSKSKSKFMFISKSCFLPFNMLLVFPLHIMLLFIILIAYRNYDQYSDIRKRFNGYKNVSPELFQMKKQNVIIYGPSNSGKTTFIKHYFSLYETINVFCVDIREWKVYNKFCVNELDLFKNPEDFANSLVIIDDMGDNIRTPVVDNFYSSGRHNNIDIISVGHTVTDLKVKARENTPSIFHTLNSSHLFFERI